MQQPDEPDADQPTGPGPRRLPDEVMRPRLVERLACRWKVAVTIVEAAGGYGKSVALAQAIRDNAEDPSGVDVYVACRRSEGEAVRFVTRVLDAIGAEATVSVDDVGRLADLLSSRLAVRSPTRVALVLDDLHLLRPDDSTVALLAALVRQLPTNVRLVLSGRTVPPLPLQRLVAADDVERITAEELNFTDDEVRELARVHRVDHRGLRSAAGWPAVTRLAITVGTVASLDYLMEEVVESLDVYQRRAIAIASIARRLPASMIAGLSGAASTARALRNVPLVSVHDDGTVTAHDLWAEALPRLLPADERTELAAAVVQALVGERRFDEAVDIGIAHEAWKAAFAAVVAYVAGGATFPTARLCHTWLERFPRHLHAAPELRLLRGFAARLAGHPEDGVADLEAALAAFIEAGDDPAGFAAAGFQVGYGAWLRGDLRRALEVVEMGRSAAADGFAGGSDQLSQFVVLADGLIADLQGEPERALGFLERVGPGDVPAPLFAAVVRERVALWHLVGDSARGLEVARSMEPATNDQVAFTLALASWFDADPEPARRRWGTLRHMTRQNTHDAFLGCVYSTIIDASFGLRSDLDVLAAFPTVRPREAAFQSIADAAGRVAAGDEAGAVAAIDALVAAGHLETRLGSGELRRLLPIPYVLSEEVRGRIDRDAERLGPRQHRWRCLARLFVDARAGADPDWSALPAAAEVLCAFPLRWSVELAALAAAAGVEAGPALMTYLSDTTDARGRVLLEELLEAPAVAVGCGARLLLDVLPTVPDSAVRIVACGPMRVVARIDPDPSIMRRVRVRELLGLLVVRERVSIDRLLSSLWPDLDPSHARNNLRITLTFLRRLLEPDRPPGEPSFHVVRSPTHVWLRRSSSISCDVWEIDDALAAAAAADQAHDARAAIDHLATAVAAWTGDMAVDIRDHESASADVIARELALADAAARVAEWSLSQGRLAAAVATARRLLAFDPYQEQAYAVIISAHLMSGELDLAQLAGEQCRAALDELRVAPGNAMAMVFKQLDEVLAATGDRSA